MRRGLRAKLLASALVLTAVPLMVVTAPAQAQYYAGIGFDSFHDQLEQYGYWLYSDRWGLVWQPSDVSYDFKPYFSGGHWVYTDDYGWYWASEFPWGDIAFHYGRWVFDPDDGWLWIPGYTWSPAWVVWRTNGEFVGWMPAPPDRAFLEGAGDVSFGVSFGGISFNWSDPWFGYRTWYGRDFDERRFADNWVFVNAGRLADRDYRRFAVRDPMVVVNLIRTTRNITNYRIVNNYVVNRSIDVRLVERAAGHPIEVAPARMVIRQPNLVTRVDVGRQVMMRERMVAPRGMGFANSAPPPPPSVVNKLSVQVAPRNGRPPVHLFTRSTISNPEAQARFRGPMPGQGPREGGPQGFGPGRPGEQQGPNGPGGVNGPGGGPGNGPGNQPQGEMRHHEQPNPNGPGGMNGPGGGPGNENQPQGEMRHHEQPNPNGPGGMNGPGGGPGGGPGNENQPQGEMRHHEQPGSNGPGGMNGPGGGPTSGPGNENQPQGEMRHHEQPSPNGPGGMNGPGGGPGSSPSSGNQPQGEMRHHEQPNPNGPGGTNGPAAGAPGGMTGPGGPQGEQNQPNPPKKKEKKPPPEQQPATPPQ